VAPRGWRFGLGWRCGLHVRLGLPVTEAPSSSESANAAVAAVANERQTRCNVFEAAAEVEEAEGEHKLAKDSKSASARTAWPCVKSP